MLGLGSVAIVYFLKSILRQAAIGIRAKLCIFKSICDKLRLVSVAIMHFLKSIMLTTILRIMEIRPTFYKLQFLLKLKTDK